MHLQVFFEEKKKSISLKKNLFLFYSLTPSAMNTIYLYIDTYWYLL